MTSIRARTRSSRTYRPASMDEIALDNETRIGLTNVAVGIFTDASNAHRSFQECLLAVYLSGLNHGSCAAADNDKPQTASPRRESEAQNNER